MTINKTLTEITIADLQSLVDDKEAESQTIDYKETIKLEVPQNKEEFRRDASSFANASGGDYILASARREASRLKCAGCPWITPMGSSYAWKKSCKVIYAPVSQAFRYSPFNCPTGRM